MNQIQVTFLEFLSWYELTGESFYNLPFQTKNIIVKNYKSHFGGIKISTCYE